MSGRSRSKARSEDPGEDKNTDDHYCDRELRFRFGHMIDLSASVGRYFHNIRDSVSVQTSSTFHRIYIHIEVE